MPSFQVNDMSCSHCVSTITKALQAADPGAKVAIDLPSHRVSIDSATASTERLGNAIREAGYTPVPVTNASA